LVRRLGGLRGKLPLFEGKEVGQWLQGRTKRGGDKNSAQTKSQAAVDVKRVLGCGERVPAENTDKGAAFADQGQEKGGGNHGKRWD